MKRRVVLDVWRGADSTIYEFQRGFPVPKMSDKAEYLGWREMILNTSDGIADLREAVTDTVRLEWVLANLDTNPIVQDPVTGDWGIGSMPSSFGYFADPRIAIDIARGMKG